MMKSVQAVYKNDEERKERKEKRREGGVI